MAARRRLAEQRKEERRALETMRRVELGGLPVIIQDERGRVWEIWDLDFEG